MPEGFGADPETMVWAYSFVLKSSRMRLPFWKRTGRHWRSWATVCPLWRTTLRISGPLSPPCASQPPSARRFSPGCCCWGWCCGSTGEAPYQCDHPHRQRRRAFVRSGIFPGQPLYSGADLCVQCAAVTIYLLSGYFKTLPKGFEEALTLTDADILKQW